MKTYRFFVLFALVLFSVYACSTQRSGIGESVPVFSDPVTVFQNVSVLPMHGKAPVLIRPGQTVVVEDGRINYVGRQNSKFRKAPPSSTEQASF